MKTALETAEITAVTYENDDFVRETTKKNAVKYKTGGICT